MTGELIRTRVPSERTAEVAGVTTNVRYISPAADSPVKWETPVVLVHGAGLSSYSFRFLAPQLAEKGFSCLSPDFPGHGKTAAPPAGQFPYTADAYADWLEAFIEQEAGGAPCDFVMHGFVLPQAAMLLGARRPELFRRVVLLNTPLTPGQHALPPPLAAFTRPLVGKRAKAQSDQLAATGNLYAIKYDDAMEFQAPYEAGDGEARRVALLETVTKEPLKGLLERVDGAWGGSGVPTHVLWGVADSALSEQKMYDWVVGKTNVTFDALLNIGHAPQEDFVAATAEKAVEFLAMD